MLEAVETDLPDNVLQRLLDTAEEDVHRVSSRTERECLPLVVWTGSYTPTLGQPDGSLALPISILGFPIVRFEGTVEVGADNPTYQDDTEALDVDGGTDTITPVTPDDTGVTAGAYVLTIDSTGQALTVDTTLTTAAVTITRILGLQTAVPPFNAVSAVIDLVKVGVIYRGLVNEQTGQYSVVFSGYHAERAKILGRLIFASSESLVV